MPLDSRFVGSSTKKLVHDVDARWLMAYAAGLDDFNPIYMDTEAQTVIAHPVFPVCLEWPVILLGFPRIAGVAPPSREESARAVHGAHDLQIYRPIKAGDKLATRGHLVDVRKRPAGAASTLRLDTTDAVTGELVARTWQIGVYRGVDVAGGDRNSEPPLALPETQPPAWGAQRREIEVGRGAAHIYTECARIWNPIHTDRAVALATGLPDIVLHGTATLALAISQIVNVHADGDPTRVQRLGGKFKSLVLMPSTLRLESQLCGGVVSYQVKTETGEFAIKDGFVCLQSQYASQA